MSTFLHQVIEDLPSDNDAEGAAIPDEPDNQSLMI